LKNIASLPVMSIKTAEASALSHGMSHRKSSIAPKAPAN
jgi:hypothetical protein